MRKQALLGDMRGALRRAARFVGTGRVANAARGGYRQIAQQSHAAVLG